jgi:hypothetical protein
MTMKQDLMARLLKGWTTPVDALKDCNCFSLSQRCGEFRRERENYDWRASWRSSKFGDGTPPPMIIDKWVDLPNGKRVKAYRAIK